MDRSFVTDIPGDKNDTAITHAIVSLAHSLELAAVAEGLATKAQRECLCAIGRNRFQGFLYSKPLTTEAFACIKAEGSQCVRRR